MTNNKKMKVLLEGFKTFLTENTLHVQKQGYGGLSIEDSEGNEITLGMIVKALLGAGKTGFAPEKGIEAIKHAVAEGHHDGGRGGIEFWDADVFEGYGVDSEQAIKIYAAANNMTIEVEETAEYGNEDYG